MDFLDRVCPTLAENLALEDALLLEAEGGNAEECLRLWEWPHPAVVLGAGGRLAADVNEAACLADGVPVLRRASGGGTVLLGKGCLLYSLLLAYARAPALSEIRSSYAYIFEHLRAALEDAVPGIEVAGTSDLAVAGLKFSGNAQQRKRRYLLHHGTMLYGFDVELVGRYLRQPARQPEYRHHRAHAAFLMNLPLPAEEIQRRLCAAWQADTPRTTWPEEEMRQLAADKYNNPAWTRRR
jgi:lipoate-protein ligase A